MKLLSNLKIGSKLSIGFGLLVFLTLVVIGLSYLGSLRTTTYINRTSNLSAPTALASAHAQASLLRMLADVWATWLWVRKVTGRDIPKLAGLLKQIWRLWKPFPTRLTRHH